MAELPTTTEIFKIRSDIDTRLSEKLDLEHYMNIALEQVKRDIEDKKGVQWRWVYDSTNAIYFDNTDATGRNDDRIKHAISLLTVALIFRDYSINSRDDGKWWGLYESYKMDYDNLIDIMTLDVDKDESGTIEEAEESEKLQVFLTR